MSESNQLRARWTESSDIPHSPGEGIRAGRAVRVWTAITIVILLANLSLGVWYGVTTGDWLKFLSHQLLSPIAAAAYTVLGALVVSNRPRNPIGWLFMVTGTSYALSALAAGLIVYGSVLPVAISASLMELAQWLDIWVWLPALILPTAFVFLLFPDGHLLSPRWRIVAWAAGLGLLLTMLGLALLPGPVESWATAANPYGLVGTEAALEIVLTVGTVLLMLGTAGSVVAVLVRFRRSRGDEREQMKWLAYAAAFIIFLVFAAMSFWLSGGAASPIMVELSIALTTLAMLVIAIAASIAILRYHLYDIDIIINRTVVYGLMTGVVVAIYGLVVGGASILFQTQSNWVVALIATGLVAVLFQPIRERLQRGVNRLLYGQRDEPFEVLAELGQRLEQSVTPASVYPTIVATVAEALRLPYVALQERAGADFVTVESYGKPGGDFETLPLAYQGELIGRLLVGRRTPGEMLTAADQRLLENLARQAGAAVYGARLTADLQRSRQQIVTSREEERRRLRRDLHDGLGPALASLLLEARVLRRTIPENPDAAVALVEEMQGDIRGTIEDIRRVVHELRPPALDDLGLIPALNVMASKVSRGESGAPSEFHVVVTAPDDMPPLPAAVEVAAYRIIQEALANVIHHAHAHSATVRLALDDDLIVEVEDDGIGFKSGRDGGLGLHSMRERAAELGGRCTVSALPDGGTLVRAMLPVGEM